MTKMDDPKGDKLSIYTELESLVYWLAHQNADSKVTLMEFEEIAGELFLEVAKGLNYYSDKPAEEQVKIIKRMLDNRLGELRYKYYTTHRKESIGALSIENHGEDENEETLSLPAEDSVEDLQESTERVRATRSLLSPTARRVFDAVIYGNKLLKAQIWLSTVRASYVYKASKVQMRPWHIADALQLDESEVRQAFKEISQAYRYVMDSDSMKRNPISHIDKKPYTR